ncbi:hypothetical protein DFJ58DRAFT_839200 [Suillus subalutaceus]|uniref:uncharacterized protein n=1 Tax=Suillus subalutaceus TaxID=48586 RepID=UPI001B876BC0|nr:uncharacterized protein DFJ58DRAFT_839200 [Suillus subalutaceus]KAG1863231.1 hypothetical protein DFJ58DRAFT_839200 [Suillus subalutaceus]
MSRLSYACDTPAIRDPNTSLTLKFDGKSFHSQSSLQLMLKNECLACSKSDASMVMQLKHKNSELQHAVTCLQADRAMLVSENTTLSTKCETLQNVIRGSTNSITSNSSETSNNTKDEQKPCLLDTITDEECDRELDPEDYPHLSTFRTSKGILSLLSMPRQSDSLCYQAFVNLRRKVSHLNQLVTSESWREYKSKATAQARSSSTQQAVNREDAINVDK